MTDDLTNASIDTRVIHAGELRPRINGAITLPIFQSATYELSGESDYHVIPYLRLSNSPNHVALHRKLANLEQAEDALVTASGMAAISAALFGVLKAGDHVLAQTGLYGGTHTFITRDLPQFGIRYDLVDLNDPDDWQRKVKPNTGAFYVESMTNPLLQVGDLAAVPDFCAQHRLVAVIDNTLPSPVNFNPATIGFDIVVHSCTKYLNGHSDIVAGAVIGNCELVQKAKHKLDHLGGTLDPHACFLLHRGIKTLPLRVARQNSNTLALAKYLNQHRNVSAVYYAGLESHSDHARAQKYFSGYGGLLSFEYSGAAAAHKMIEKLQLVTEAVSLGGVETLITLPAETSHVGISVAERAALGISDGLVRVAVGVEGEQDLIDDFAQALG